MSTYLDLQNYSCERVGISYLLAKRMSNMSLFFLIIVINGQKLWKNFLSCPEGVAKFKNLQVGSEVEEEEFSYLLLITYYLLAIVKIIALMAALMGTVINQAAAIFWIVESLIA